MHNVLWADDFKWLLAFCVWSALVKFLARAAWMECEDEELSSFYPTSSDLAAAS